MFLGLAPIRAKRARFMAEAFRAPKTEDAPPSVAYDGNAFLEAGRIWRAAIDAYKSGEAVTFLKALDARIAKRNYPSITAFEEVISNLDRLMIHVVKGSKHRHIVDWCADHGKRDILFQAERVLMHYLVRAGHAFP